MLGVGDKVVYPMYGAGVIEAIEEHEVMGQTQQYYVMTIPYGAMKVMIPMKNVDTVGLRSIIGHEEVDNVADVLRDTPAPNKTNWNRRFNMNLAKIKSGNINEVAEVVRNLTLQDRIKKLSTGERRLLNSARQILISELALACGKDDLVVENWIDDLIVNKTPGN